MANARRAFAAELPPEVADAAFTTLPRRLWPLFAPAGAVGLYRATPGEAPTAALIDFVADSRRVVALPRLEDGVMSYRRWAPGDPLERGVGGVEQPMASAELVEPALVFAPLLAFDARLNRLGRGAGHYDRWLATHPPARAIGLGWSVQEVDAVPTEPHDRPLDAVLTERAVLARAS